MKEYNGEIVHFFGGIHEYIGELEQPTYEHKPGAVIEHQGCGTIKASRPGWYRILNPCVTGTGKDEKGRQIRGIFRIWGDNKDYHKHVDIYCPPDSLMEIRVLNKEGGLYKAYQEQLSRVEHDRIVPATGADIRNIGSAQQLKRDKRKDRMFPGKS